MAKQQYTAKFRIIADTKKFTEGTKLGRREVNILNREIRKLQSPLDKMQDELDQLGDIAKENALAQDVYNEKLKRFRDLQKSEAFKGTLAGRIAGRFGGRGGGGFGGSFAGSAIGGGLARGGAAGMGFGGAGLAAAGGAAAGVGVAAIGYKKAYDVYQSAGRLGQEIRQLEHYLPGMGDHFLQLKSAAGAAGTDVYELADAMNEMRLRVTDAVASGAKMDVFEQLGFDEKRLAKLDSMDVVDVVDELGRAIGELPIDKQQFFMDEFASSAGVKARLGVLALNDELDNMNKLIDSGSLKWAEANNRFIQGQFGRLKTYGLSKAAEFANPGMMLLGVQLERMVNYMVGNGNEQTKQLQQINAKTEPPPRLEQ